MYCKWRLNGDVFVCGVCGVVRPIKCLRKCAKSSKKGLTKPQLLGDRTEQILKKLDITPESYTALKEKFGLAPSCNCKARKAWLNNVHAYAKEYGWVKALTDPKDRKLYMEEPR